MSILGSCAFLIDWQNNVCTTVLLLIDKCANPYFEEYVLSSNTYNLENIYTLTKTSLLCMIIDVKISKKWI